MIDVKKILIYVLALLWTIESMGQTAVQDIDIYLYNTVYKNIAAYNITYASVRLNGTIKIIPFRSNANQFYNAFLTDYGYKMKMEVEKLDWQYPDKRYQLYKIFIDRFEHDSPNDTTVVNFYGRFTTKLFLIALNPSNGDVKFISGQFFTSTITEDFQLNRSDPNTFLEFLKFKTFRYQINNIEFLNKKHKALFFKGYSMEYDKLVKIKVAIKDTESFVIQPYK